MKSAISTQPVRAAICRQGPHDSRENWLHYYHWSWSYMSTSWPKVSTRVESVYLCFYCIVWVTLLRSFVRFHSPAQIKYAYTLIIINKYKHLTAVIHPKNHICAVRCRSTFFLIYFRFFFPNICQRIFVW